MEKGWRLEDSEFSAPPHSTSPHLKKLSHASSSWALIGSGELFLTCTTSSIPSTWSHLGQIFLFSFKLWAILSPFSAFIYYGSITYGVCIHFLIFLLFGGDFERKECKGLCHLCHLETISQLCWVWILLIISKSWKPIKYEIIIQNTVEIKCCEKQ